MALEPVCARFAPEPDAAHLARHFVASAIAPWTVPGDCEIAILLVSELVTNALVHAQTPVEVTVRIYGSVLRVEVRDDRPERRIPGVDAADDHGRGLRIVDALATAWGTNHDEYTKTVWFDLALVPRSTQQRNTHNRETNWQ